MELNPIFVYILFAIAIILSVISYFFTWRCNMIELFGILLIIFLILIGIKLLGIITWTGVGIGIWIVITITMIMIFKQDTY